MSEPRSSTDNLHHVKTAIEREEETPKHMKCDGCGESCLRLKLRPCDTGTGWQGGINAKCKQCMAGDEEEGILVYENKGEMMHEKVAPLSANQWNSRCKMRWAVRLAIATDRNNMAKRVTSWAKACEEIDKDPECQGVSRAEKRSKLK